VGKIMLGVVIVMMILYALNAVSLDQFLSVWTYAFVAAVKGAVFAAIPLGFLFGAYFWLKEAAS